MKGIIFDCDGVLFESCRANLAYYNRILAQFQRAPVTEADAELAHLCHTAASPVVLERLLGPELAQQGLDYAAQLDYRDFVHLMTPGESLHQSLAQLAGHCRLAVATNRGGSMARILDCFELGDYFSAVVTSADVRRPKPHPEMLLRAADLLGLRREEVLFVGDSVLDQQAARAAGIAFVAYRQPLDGARVVEHYTELLPLLAEARATVGFGGPQ